MYLKNCFLLQIVEVNQQQQSKQIASFNQTSEFDSPFKQKTYQAGKSNITHSKYIHPSIRTTNLRSTSIQQGLLAKILAFPKHSQNISHEVKAAEKSLNSFVNIGSSRFFDIFKGLGKGFSNKVILQSVLQDKKHQRKQTEKRKHIKSQNRSKTALGSIIGADLQSAREIPLGWSTQRSKNQMSQFQDKHVFKRVIKSLPLALKKEQKIKSKPTSCKVQESNIPHWLQLVNGTKIPKPQALQSQKQNPTPLQSQSSPNSPIKRLQLGNKRGVEQPIILLNNRKKRQVKNKKDAAIKTVQTILKLGKRYGEVHDKNKIIN